MISAALDLAKRFWPFLAIGGLLIAAWLYVGHVDRTARKEQKAADYAAVKAAQVEAALADITHAREVETARAAATKEANDAYAPRLASYRDSLASYSARLRDQAAQGGGGSADVPSPTDRPNVTDGADRLSVLDEDLARCTQAVVRLENARDWWATIEAQPK